MKNTKNYCIRFLSALIFFTHLSTTITHGFSNHHGVYSGYGKALSSSKIYTNPFSPKPLSKKRDRYKKRKESYVVAMTKENTQSEGLPYSEFIHPKTGCQVILVGCLHGSSSSAQEVTEILNKKKTDTVVLELCATRFRDVIRGMEVSNNAEHAKFKPGWRSYINMVIKTTKKLGVSSGIAAALLGGFSNMQTALSGFEPGLEFIQAIQYTKANDGCNLVLADQDVGETLKRLGDIPNNSLALFLSLLGVENGRESKINLSTLPFYSRSLFSSVNGYDDVAAQNKLYQVNMGKVLLRDSSAMKDLIQLTMTPLLALSVLFFIMNLTRAGDIGMLEHLRYGLSIGLTFPESSSFTASIIQDILWELGSSIMVLVLGYIFLAIPVGKVIIHERDDQLARGVAAACQEIALNRSYNHKDGENLSESDKDEQTPNGRVVAVLGLLHVNGVTKRLLEENDC